jgi:hypothetical protein
MRFMVSRLRFWLVFGLMAGLLAAQSVPPAAVTPTSMMRYFGQVLDSSGIPRSGLFTITFSLYAGQFGGTAIWSEQQSITLDEAGRYVVVLGAMNSLSASLFPTSEQRWLGVQIQNELELPRVSLIGVPYAIASSNADRLGGHVPGDFVLQSQLPEDLSAWQSSSSQNPSSGSVTLNAIPKVGSGGQLVNSAIYESNGLVGIGTTSPTQALQVNGSLRLIGQTTHQIEFTGVASSGRFGQDLVGPFFASDSPGKAIRLVTSGITERMRITDSGNVGIATPEPSATLEVAGGVKISGPGNGLTFPDGTTQTTALPAGAFSANQEVQNLVSDQTFTVGASPSIYGQAAIIPDNLDSVQSSIGQAGQQAHFRLSRSTPDTAGAKDFLIVPYTYGMAIEYPGVIEVWSQDFSVHFNHRLTGPETPARFWVGDEIDSGGLYATSFDRGGGSNSYTVLASDRFSHTSHGPLVFQVRAPGDAFNFQWGAYNSEVTRASLTNGSTATNLVLNYATVQATVTADSNGTGSVNFGSTSTTPVNLLAGNAPRLTVFPDGNVSVGNTSDTAMLSVGSGGQFTVSNGGAVTASTVTTTALATGSMTTAALTSGGLTLTGPLVAVDIHSSGTLTAALLNATAITTPSLSSASATVGTLSATTLNSGAASTASLAIGGGTPIVNHLSQAPMIDFDSFPPNACLTQTVVVPGASDGDTVALGIPNVLGSIDGVTWFAWAGAQDSVSIRGCNATASATVDPAPAAIRIDIWKH